MERRGEWTDSSLTPSSQPAVSHWLQSETSIGSRAAAADSHSKGEHDRTKA